MEKERRLKQVNNLFTYLKWRGDLKIEECPFNAVDALILCEIAYIKFENMVPKLKLHETISLEEAAKRYQHYKGKNILYYAEKEELFEAAAKTVRFASIGICNYVNTIDLEKQEQFSALHYMISAKFHMIAFRGTDQSIVGWRENFNMSYMMPVPAQTSAVDYVNKTAKGRFHKFWIAGHSKGGNLAIYSAMFCNRNIQKKIVQVNSFDGPGFNRKVVNDEPYIRIKNRIFAYVPESSIVGMLMEHEEDYKVVKSSEFAMKQHEGLSWEVSGNHFVFVDEVDGLSSGLNTALKLWMKEISPEERKEFVDTIFRIFEENNINTLEDITAWDARTAASLLKAVAKVPQKQRALVLKLIKLLVEESKKNK